MAFSFGGSNELGGGRRRFRTSGTLSEINVVPLVDVVLVLLIIFMLTAHVMEYGMEINVPQVKNAEGTTEELPVINITRKGNLFLNEAPITNINLIAEQIRQRFKNARAVYVRSDAQTPMGIAVNVFAELRDAGLDVKLVTKPYDSGNK